MPTSRIPLPVRILAVAWLATMSTGLLAAPATESAPAPAPAPSMFGELLGIVVPLVLIILVLLAVLYFARRRFGLTGQDAPLSIVQILPVGPRERVVVVKARSGKVFVVGVGSQNVTFIKNMEPSDLIIAGDSTADLQRSAR